MSRTRRLPSQRGAAMVETIIVLPVVLFVMFAIVELSRAFFTAHLATTAVREAARMAAAAPTHAEAVSRGTARMSAVLSAASMLSCPPPEPGFSCVVTSSVTLRDVPELPAPPPPETPEEEVVASATVRFQTIFANLLPAWLSGLDIAQTAVMRYEGGTPAP